LNNADRTIRRDIVGHRQRVRDVGLTVRAGVGWRGSFQRRGRRERRGRGEEWLGPPAEDDCRPGL